MKIRFGSIVTDGRGKAGGQSIRKFGSMHVLSNITIPVRRLASLANTQRLLNAWLFSRWSQLPQADQLAWNVVGSNLTAYNIFGDVRTVSGREAFNKCNMIYYPFANELVSATVFNYNVPLNGTFGFATNITLGEFFVFTTGSDMFNFAELRASRLKFLGQKKNVKQLKIFSRLPVGEGETVLWDDFLAAYPDVQQGQFFSIALRLVNSSGIASPYFQANIIID